MLRNTPRASTFIVALTLAIGVNAQESQPKQVDSYYILLHSRSLVEQRKALTAVINDPQPYIPRIQQSLRNYPRMLRTDPVAANRTVYISALLRDPSFSSLLVKNLGNADVLGECEYPCPVVFALTIQASFAGWKLPSNLDSQLTTVVDLRASIRNVSHLTLKVRSIDDTVQGPALEEHRKEIEGKTEEQLIQLAGATSKSYDTRLFAVYRLETLVTNSRNRIELYLLAINEIRDDSGEYRDAVYQAIYGAELAKARAGSVSNADIAASFVGKNSCDPELKFATTRYGIRLDSSQNAYLMAYRLKAANILAIVQYDKKDQTCGIIRDVVQSRDHDSSFVWECYSPKVRSDVVVGTWPATYPNLTGSAVEAWQINLKALKLELIQGPVKCDPGPQRGNDEGDSLADWARERAARYSMKPSD